MEVMLILFVIVLIGVILIGSILGLTSSGRITKLEQQNRNLNARLKALEGAESTQGNRVVSAPTQDSSPQPQRDPSSVPWHEREEQSGPEGIASAAKAVPKPAPQPVAAKAATPPTQSPNLAAKASPKPKKPKRNLEESIGGQWSVWVGLSGLAINAGLAESRE